MPDRPQLDWNRAILNPGEGNRFRAEYYAAWKKDSGAPATASSRVHVEPRATDELLANPGMGWQTFHRFADDDNGNLRIRRIIDYLILIDGDLQSVSEVHDLGKVIERRAVPRT